MKGGRRRGCSRVGISVGLCVLLCLAGGCGSPKTSPRHVVLISIDTLRKDHLPCYGYAKDTAPFMSELASESVVFDNAFAAASVTVPSHASILTGLSPPRHGALNNKCRVRVDAVLLAEILSQQGFSTAAFVGGAPLKQRLSGLERGFETYDDDFGTANQRTADETVRRVDDWLTTADVDRPTFFFVHFYDPHYPYSPPPDVVGPMLPVGSDLSPSPPYPEFIRMRDRGLSEDEMERFEVRYDGEIRFVDHHLGRLLNQLKTRGYLANGLLIVVSDHGETLAERDWAFDHGCRLYEEQIRVPLLIRFPGGRDGGRRVEAEVHHIDLAPTILVWLGLDPPPVMEGTPLVAASTGREVLGERILFSTARRDLRRVPVEDDSMEGMAFIASARSRREKLIAYPVADGFEFEVFDLEQDPAETINLASTRPERRAQLWAELQNWLGGRPNLLREAPETLSPKLKPAIEEALEELGYIETAVPIQD